MTKRIKQVAEDLEVSSQTIRNYLKIGPQFFSERATHKTRKRFDDNDLLQLRLIKAHFANGLTAKEIEQRLTPAARIVDDGQTIGQEDHEPDPEDTTPPKTEPEQTKELAPRYEQTIAAQQQTIVLQNDYIEHLKSENERLQTELTDLRLPWFRRIFGNSPK